MNSQAVRKTLAQLGIPPSELSAATAQVQNAIQSIQQSERGRWILDSHAEAQCEYAVTGVLNGAIVRGTVDRTFVDASGTRWIIDYKTACTKEPDGKSFWMANRGGIGSSWSAMRNCSGH